MSAELGSTHTHCTKRRLFRCRRIKFLLPMTNQILKRKSEIVKCLKPQLHAPAVNK